MLLAQTGDGFADRRRVMGEIVIQRNTASLAFALQAAAHASKPGERLDRGLRLDTGMTGGGDRGDAVQPVVFPGLRPFQPADGPPLPANLECTLVVRLARLPPGANPELLNRSPATLGNNALQSRIPPIHDESAGAWHDTYQM
jgi:hypothetical protein